MATHECIVCIRSSGLKNPIRFWATDTQLSIDGCICIQNYETIALTTVKKEKSECDIPKKCNFSGYS